MPNWCSNAAYFSHPDPEKIDLLFENRDGLFAALRPYEGEWSYAWCVLNWGTKWDADVSEIERMDDNTALVVFETAWSPPLELYYWIDYDVDAVFYEPNMELMGAVNTLTGEQRSYEPEEFDLFCAENPLTEWCV